MVKTDTKGTTQRRRKGRITLSHSLSHDVPAVPILQIYLSVAMTAVSYLKCLNQNLKSLTFYGVHEKRNSLAMDHFNILPNYKGRLIHDFWKPYLPHDCDHGLCNAHHLRELIFLCEQQGQVWAKRMFNLLLEMNHFVGQHNTQFTSEQKTPWLKLHHEIMAEDCETNSLPEKLPKKKSGLTAKRKTQNLLTRLGDYEDAILAFLHDVNGPFTNNFAEQDICMIQDRLEISGCFRTVLGAEHFARIRSYLSTARKLGKNILDSITDATEGSPFLSVAFS